MIKTNSGDFIKARAVAYRIVREFELEHPDQIQIENIAMLRGLLVIDAPLFGADARLIRRGDKGILRVRSDITELGKRRFVIAHDLGHWELHKGQSQWTVFADSDQKGYLHSPMELEATIFASELLMPTSMVRPYCEDLEPGIKEVKAIAEIFKVSLTAAAIKFVEECSYPCVVVFSNNGKVTWWKPNDKCPKIWIDKNQELSRNSFAWECLQSPEAKIIGGDVYDISTWFKEEAEFSGLYEESIKLGKYGTILTLLYLI